MAPGTTGERTPAPDAGSHQRGIQSIEIGGRILKALQEARGSLMLKDLAAAADLPPSNCHRYLVSLSRAGFIRQDPQSGRYDFGPEAIAVGLSAMSRLDCIRIATDTLERTVDETGFTGLLAIWNGVTAVIVRWLPGRLSVRTTLSVGDSLPLLTSATGQVFLSFLPERQVDGAVARGGGEAGAVRALIATIREAGLATVSGAHIPGLSAVSVPVLDAHGEAVCALTLVGLAEGIPDVALAALRRNGAQASRALGWVADA